MKKTTETPPEDPNEAAKAAIDKLLDGTPPTKGLPSDRPGVLVRPPTKKK